MSSTPISTQYETLARRIEADGWASAAGVVDGDLLERVAAELPAPAERRGGVRDLLAAAPTVGLLADHEHVRALAQAVLGPHCFIVRALLFDKTPEANWKVAWHQDLTIAVNRRLDMPGYGPWSTKGGVDHVQPPIEVLESMLAVRIHLDDCGPDNGPVRVIPGSHRDGRLTTEEIKARVDPSSPLECPIDRGGVLAFKPLILHASSQANLPCRRRVIHFEFAACELSGGLEWQTRR